MKIAIFAQAMEAVMTTKANGFFTVMSWYPFL